MNYLLCIYEYIYIESDLEQLQQIISIRKIKNMDERLKATIRYLDYYSFTQYVTYKLNNNKSGSVKHIYDACLCCIDHKDIVKIFNWFRYFTDIHVSFKHSDMGLIFMYDHIDLLNWITENNIPYTIDQNLIYQLGIGRSLNILKWYITNIGVDKLPTSLIDDSCRFGETDILDWILENGIKFIYSRMAFIHASEQGHINIFKWFKEHNLNIIIDEHAIDLVCMRGYIHLLDWFKNNNIEINCTADMTNIICASNRVNVLDWMVQNNIKIDYYPNVMEGYFTYYTEYDPQLAHEKYDTIKWFINHGYK